MDTTRKDMKIGLSLIANGTHQAAWRLPEAHADSGLDLNVWVEMAQAAERAKIHFMFLPDGDAVRIAAKDDEELSYSSQIEKFEPMTLIAAMAMMTQKLGFIATASTTYNTPYQLARRLASLDFITGGRVGWNVVTSWSEAEARNFGRDGNDEHALRYRRANEFVNVVRGLWDSFEDNAFKRDKQNGQYFDPSKMHVVNHDGEFFKVRGPLNIERPPQGYPVIAQAGASADGQGLAARTADIVYAMAGTLTAAQSFYNDLKGRVVAEGRSADDVSVLPGILPVIGATRQEARDKYDEMQGLIDPKVGLAMLARSFGDLSAYPLDGPLPDDLANPDGVKSVRDKLLAKARNENLTIRQLYQDMVTGAGHVQVIGTASDVADVMEEWYTQKGCDGFCFLATYNPGSLYQFLDGVVPELQRRGVFRKDYQGKLLRENLGLPRPAHPSIA